MQLLIGLRAYCSPQSRSSKSKTLNALAGLFLLTLMVGCGGKPAVVTGTITVDGEPLTQGSVTFAPSNGGLRASGVIQSDGSYEIRTNRDAGLDIGEYDVAVVSREVIITSSNTPPMPGKYLAPKRYGKVKTSGLHYAVQKGSNIIDIDLSSEGLEADSKLRTSRK